MSDSTLSERRKFPAGCAARSTSSKKRNRQASGSRPLLLLRDDGAEVRRGCLSGTQGDFAGLPDKTWKPGDIEQVR
jgi:hypothetical protein